MIHVNIPDEGIKIEGTIGDIVADVCTVLAEICDESKIDPEFLIDKVKDTFLTGYRKAHEEDDEDDEDGDALRSLAESWLLDVVSDILSKGVSEDGKDERSEKAVQGTRRRNRRRLN